MWLIDAFLASFDYPTNEWRIQVFRVLLAAACVVKGVEAFRHGGWDRFSAENFERYRLAMTKPRLAPIIIRFYRPVLVIRLAASFGLLWGPPLSLWITILLISFLVELGYEFRFHTVYIMMLLLALTTAGAPGVAFSWSHDSSTANTWCQVLVVVLTSHVYINSAWKKVRSRQFRSGALMAQFVHVNLTLAPRLRYREFWFPPAIVKLLGRGDSSAKQRWKMLSGIAIVLELLLPAGLLWNESYLYAASAGVLMHTAFTFLLPRRLLPFSIATVATYLLFQP